MSSKVSYHKAELPLTTLNYLRYGKGEPLIMVPATISEIDNWLNLVHFFGQKFQVYFFELPGHGQSSSFSSTFSSDLLAETVEHFIDYLNYQKVSILGFSFGGILTLKTLLRLENRIDKVILISPCVTHKALKHTPFKIKVMKRTASVMKSKHVQHFVLNCLHNKITVNTFLWLLATIGNVENTNLLKNKLLLLKPSTLEVLVCQINEILNIEFQINTKFQQPCYLAMSVNDPLLDYKLTKNVLNDFFSQVNIKEFKFDFHQPPNPFTLEELNNRYGDMIKLIK